MKQWQRKDIVAVMGHPAVVVAHIPNQTLESARQNEKRPAWIRMAVPDDFVKSIRGAEEKQPVFAIVVIPSDIRQQAESPIIQPGVITNG